MIRTISHLINVSEAFMLRNLNKSHIFRLFATSSLLLGVNTIYKKHVNQKQLEDEDIPLTCTRYEQRRLLEEGRISKGVCAGLAMRQVTQKGDEEDKAIALQNKYFFRLENMFIDSLGEYTGRRPDRERLKTQEMYIFARLFIESNELENKVNYPYKVMIQKKSSGAGSPEDALHFIQEESGERFEMRNTFLIAVDEIDGNKESQHLVRFDTLTHNRCSFYDANAGLIEGRCSGVLDIYKKFVTNVYHSKKVHAVCVQHQEENKPKGP